jgi:phosphoribosylanthranilate isomerase
MHWQVPLGGFRGKIQFMKKIKIKICGLNNLKNAAEVAALQPDYIGFILYSGSPRYVSLEAAGTIIKNISTSIQKVAVLVNEPFENALKIAQSGYFDLLQLHGDESPEYCSKLSHEIRLIKAFSVSDKLPANMHDYLEFCEMFLFDTASESYGGSGQSFDHKILSEYKLDKAFILGGGISPDDSTSIKTLKTERLAAVDLNSRFEVKPGIKDIKLLKYFMEKLRENDSRN